MKTYERALWASLLALLALSLGAVILTRGWSDYRDRLRAIRLASKGASNLVDTHPLDTAQQLAPLAVTHIEEDYAGQALRLGDLSLDRGPLIRYARNRFPKPGYPPTGSKRPTGGASTQP
jgi:hypothetical protein